MQSLAIVIPAFKPDFFLQTLQSIDQQTNRNFQVYIGDDCGDDELWTIVEPFCKKNNWVYHRFTKNLGQTDLVAHWNRAVRLSCEDWVWLFSDDDLMESDCVENFFRNKELNPDSNVYKFNLRIIDSKNEIVESNFDVPAKISGFEFGQLRFNRKLFSSAVEFIFRRKSFDEANEFISFPSAWCSDDASWIEFAGSNPIVTIDKGLVFWRMSDVNISSKAGVFSQIKLEASVRYMSWFNRKFKNQVNPAFFAEQIIWLRLQMVHLEYRPGFFKVISILSKLEIPFSSFWLRAFDDLFCLSYIYWKRVIRNEKPSGFKLWLHQILPEF